MKQSFNAKCTLCVYLPECAISRRIVQAEAAFGKQMNKTKNMLARFRASCRGNITVASALLFTVVIGTVGVAVDYAVALNVKTRMQAALDVAVLNAAQDPSGDVQALVATSFNANFDDRLTGTPSVAAAKDSATVIKASASASVPASLSAVLGFSSTSLHVKSAARIGESSDACLLVLDPSASQSLLVNSGASVSAPDCEIHVKSTANPAAIFNSGSTIDSKRICIAGANIIDNGGTHPNLETSCDAIGDPYAGTLPTPSTASCDHSNGNYNGGTVNLSPGVYCGWFNFNSSPTVHFAPGVYVIKSGGWNVNGGTWTGSSVTFYYADTSKIQFNSAVDIAMSAPDAGTYKGLFMYEAPGLSHSNFILDDTRGFDVSDLIYLPSRDTIFNSGSSLTAHNFTLVVNTLILNRTNWDLDPGREAMTAGAEDGTPTLIE